MSNRISKSRLRLKNTNKSGILFSVYRWILLKETLSSFINLALIFIRGHAGIYARLEAFNRSRIIRVALVAIDDENDLERVQDPNEIKNSPSGE